ncbi:MAG: NuoI/complex I 23 kDa subunit family protein [Candidatus Kapaibacterium sp.]
MGNYFKNIWLGVWTVLIGMRITLKHMFGKKVTRQYPEKFHPIEEGIVPQNSRNRLYLDWDDCNGCNGCVRACPSNCITVDTVKVVPDDDIPPLKSGGKRGLWVTKYDIDFALCCFCGLCTDACPTFAIKTTPEFEYSSFDREDLVYHFGKMTEEQIKEKTEMFKKHQAEKKKEAAAKKAAEAKAKAAEGGKEKPAAKKSADKPEKGKKSDDNKDNE